MTDDSESLACGRRRDTLYDHLAADALDEHELSCPHCRRAAADLAPVHRATVLLRDEPADPPAGFVEVLMARIRAEARRRHRLPLPADPPMRLSISEHAAAAVLAIAADEVSGVTVRGCRFPDPDDPTHVEIAIALSYATPAPQTAERVRRRIRTAARNHLGLDLRTIDITVEDLRT
ncbi:MAG TPA: hypothetical protein VE465_12380 [Streptosporangiaceae bacterium]|nr:hypothetical protein [Streptosporangiaceae bacterium]